MKKCSKILSVFLVVVLMFTAVIPAGVSFAEDLLSSGEKTVYKGHTYIRVDASMTWKEAKAYCEANGGYLATVTSFEEQSVLMRLVADGEKLQYWLGGTDEAHEGVWEWVTGELWSYTFNNDLDNAGGVENYLQMFRMDWDNDGSAIGKWNDSSDDNYLPNDDNFFIPEHVGFIYESGEYTTFRNGEDYSVDGKTATFMGHTYTLIEETLTWQQANAYCRENGGYLATITNAREQKVIIDLMKNGEEKLAYWLGGTDEAVEGTWTWVTGEKWSYVPSDMLFDNAYGNEDYLQIQRHTSESELSGHWNDANHVNTLSTGGYYDFDNVGFIMETGDNFTAEQNADEVSEPIVYVIGRTNIYMPDGSTAMADDTSMISDLVLGSMEELADALFLGRWKIYLDKIYECMAAKFADYALNSEGEVTNGSGAAFSWNYSTLPAYQSDLYTYRFEYDCRRDPFEIADDLNDYIEAIKEKTGHSKVHLLSRCIGCNMAAAYLTKYGYGAIDTNIFYASAAKGFDFTGELFSGRIYFDDDAISRYADETIVNEDEIVEAFLKATCYYADECGIMDFGTAIGRVYYDMLAEKIVPRVLLATYATCPGYWSMVNDEYYEEAKAYIFGDEVNTTYKTLVEKIDNYHYNVMNQLDNTLLEMKNDGVRVNLICKYGFQVTPYIESTDQIGDNRIELEKQSFGANCCDIEDTFGKKYLENAEKAGTSKYISPDKQIDASTGLLPDNTWYIKNCEHNPFYNCFNPLIQEICYSETPITVSSDAVYPQYLFYNIETSTCEVLNEDNMNTREYVTGYFVSLGRFLKTMFAYLKSLLKELKEARALKHQETLEKMKYNWTI